MCFILCHGHRPLGLISKNFMIINTDIFSGIKIRNDPSSIFALRMPAAP
jgi:hypothetical protein